MKSGLISLLMKNVCLIMAKYQENAQKEFCIELYNQPTAYGRI